MSNILLLFFGLYYLLGLINNAFTFKSNIKSTKTKRKGRYKK